MESYTILCDIDGVLIWHHPDDPEKDWRKNMPSAVALELWEDFQRTPAWRACLRDQENKTRAHYQNYLKSKDQGDNENARAAIDIWLEGNVLSSDPAVQKLKEWDARGIECALATNQDALRKPQIEKWLDEQGLGGLLQFISCDLGAAKPELDYYRQIESALNKNAAQLILIDDSYENIEGARRAGWLAYHIDNSYRLRPEQWHALEFSNLLTSLKEPGAYQMV